jgi:hypothetical protein
LIIFKAFYFQGVFGRIGQFVRNIAYGAADAHAVVRQNSFYLPICSLKSRIPWLPRRSKSRRVCQDELCKMVVDVVNKNKGHLPLEETIKLCDLLGNLQDMVPYYLHSRYFTINIVFHFFHFILLLPALKKNGKLTLGN